MSAAVWEPWLTELEEASSAGDNGRLAAAMENRWRFPFYQERGRGHDNWVASPASSPF